MIDIDVKNLKKSFEVGHDVLSGLSFEINAGEHVGILGANGCGKTTLFRLLTGEYTPDEGTIAIHKGRRIGLISQIPVYPAGWTTEDVLREAHARLRAMSDRLRELEEIMGSDPAKALLDEYDRLSDDFRRLGGYDMERERNRVANGLDIPEAMREREFDKLSGGEKTRVNLARLILEDTDILLLDEPTNHLDLRATEWLEDYITHFRGTVLAISHDRYFLDTVAQRCIEIVDGYAEFYSGNYSFYAVERQRRFEEQLRKYEKDQAKIEQLQKAAAQMHLWAFMGNDKLHKRAFSMEKRIERLSQTEKPKEARKLTASFKESEFRADEAIVAEGLGKGFSGRVLFSGVNFKVTGGEHIAVIGDNGTGKSTLVKLIVGEEEPDSGYVRRGPAIRMAYLPQIVKFRDPTLSAADTVIDECHCTMQDARDSLGAFGFTGEDALKAVGTLSGGEQSRLRLCILMRSDVNLLILDEPTNHLDISSREWMEDALSSYGETLLFVSHDRYFIEKFATRIWCFENGQITDFRGTFSEFREWQARQRALAQAAKATAPKAEKKAKRSGTPEREKQLRRVEREIGKTEARLAEIEKEYEANASDYVKLMELDAERGGLNSQLDTLYLEWEELDES